MTEDDVHDTAGAGQPAPALSSPDVVEPRARVELDRLARRWGELPLARAEDRMPLLRSALDSLAALSTPRLVAPDPRAAAGSGLPGVAGGQEVEVGPQGEDEGPRPGPVQRPVVPDLGPAVVLDQVAVLVWDAYAAGRGNGIPSLLADLRRAVG